MNSDFNHKPKLNDVLNEISALDLAPDGPALRIWMEKYPEYKHEIIDFVTGWVSMDARRNSDNLTEEDVDLVVNRTMSRVQAILDANRPAAIQDILKDAKAVGHDQDSLQRTLGIDHTIMASLNARLVEPATVPLRLISLLAQTLNRTMDAVRNYILMDPEYKFAAKTSTRPKVERSTFAALVQYSLLPNDEKERWLKEAPDQEMK